MAILSFWYICATVIIGIVDAIRTSIIHMNPEVWSSIFCEISVIRNPHCFWYVTLCISTFVTIIPLDVVSIFTSKNLIIVIVQQGFTIGVPDIWIQTLRSMKSTKRM